MAAARIAGLVAAFLPFAWFAWLDTRYHLSTRKPGGPENLVHLGLGVCQLGLLVNAIRADLRFELFALAGIAVLGGLDEFGFHRALPAFESDVHAKSHFALFIFVVVALGLNYALPA